MIDDRGRSGSAQAAAEYFASRRPTIAAALESLAARRGGELSTAPEGGGESLERVAEFCLRGKMIRGCLVFLGSEAATGKALATAAAPAAGAAVGAGTAVGAAVGAGTAVGAAVGAALPEIAAAMELFQAGLLAHDDIMDRDETRRGEPTLHARYAAEASASAAAEAEALARVAGAAPDVADAAPRAGGAAPHIAGAAPEEADAAPEEADAAPHIPGAAPRAAGATPRAAGATPRAAGAATSRAEALRLGESLAICLGDLCYFEGFAALAGALSRRLGDDPRAGRILSLCAETLSEVAIAQMADVRWGSGQAEPTEAEILAMYRCKTARYSFSLPLAVGALAAGADALVGPFTELGERLGILFQIRDDELGLFGDEASTGKGLGSDLREGKKTLFRARLLAAAPASEKTRLASLFGGGAEAGPEDLAYIRRLSEELGVAASIRELAAAAEGEARAILASVEGLAPGPREALEGLVDYVTRRLS